MLNRLSFQVRSFACDDSAATAIEYALIASGIAIAIASTVFGLGTGIKTNFYDKLTGMFG